MVYAEGTRKTVPLSFGTLLSALNGLVTYMKEGEAWDSDGYDGNNWPIVFQINDGKYVSRSALATNSLSLESDSCELARYYVCHSHIGACAYIWNDSVTKRLVRLRLARSRIG